MRRKKLLIIILVPLVVMAFLQNIAFAELDRVLLVYNEKEKIGMISSLIKACGMTPVPVKSEEYSSDMIENYEYIVLQDSAPLKDVLQLGKRPVCLGDEFSAIPGVQITSINRIASIQLSVYDNTQSTILDHSFSYISDYEGEAVGSIRFGDKVAPIGVITEKIMFAPYFSKDNITVFAVAKMLNTYFGNRDSGKMYIMVDEVYPFDDIYMLELIADKFYEAGIPFVISIMPVYENTEYPSFKRYTSVLRYIHSRGGSLIMHEPIVTGNELVGDPLEVRMKKAYNNFEQNGVHLFENTFYPYELSVDMLMGIHPQKELFISFPIDTVLKFKMFEDESSLDLAIKTINKKWLQIGNYGQEFTDNVEIFEDAEDDSVYAYREQSEGSYSFLINTGNRILTAIVFISGTIIIVLIVFGYTLYKQKFLKKRED